MAAKGFALIIFVLECLFSLLTLTTATVCFFAQSYYKEVVWAKFYFQYKQ